MQKDKFLIEYEKKLIKKQRQIRQKELENHKDKQNQGLMFLTDNKQISELEQLSDTYYNLSKQSEQLQQQISQLDKALNREIANPQYQNHSHIETMTKGQILTHLRLRNTQLEQHNIFLEDRLTKSYQKLYKEITYRPTLPAQITHQTKKKLEQQMQQKSDELSLKEDLIQLALNGDIDDCRKAVNDIKERDVKLLDKKTLYSDAWKVASSQVREKLQDLQSTINSNKNQIEKINQQINTIDENENIFLQVKQQIQQKKEVLRKQYKTKIQKQKDLIDKQYENDIKIVKVQIQQLTEQISKIEFI